MRCPKCNGCLHSQIVEYPNIREEWCLNCSWRDNAPYDEPIREPYSRRKCCNCQNPPERGKSYCTKCLTYMIDYRKRKKALT